MGKRLPKPKVPPIKKIEKQCLVLWSECVRTRDRVCRICGSDYRLQAHHIRSRTNKATYLELRNGIAVCSKCHILQKFSPERFQDKVIEVIGDEKYHALKVASQHTYKPTIPDLLLLKDALKDHLRILEDEYGKRHDKIRKECGL
jgi:hypothetical protein